MTTDTSPSLPYPVVSARRRPSSSSHHSYSGRSPSLVGGSWSLLTQRTGRSSPLTLLLGLVLCLSLWGNWRMLGSHVVESKVPLSIRATLQPSHPELRHLIMVPGHAIWTGCDASTASQDQDWILEELQKGGDVRAYIKHITKGAELAVRDPSSLLIFSGGMTRPASTLSEAMSYYRLAKAGNIYEAFMSEEERARGEFGRVTTEDFALDSYQNVIYSIARFREFTGHFPTSITIVGYGMKRRRYEDVHRHALRWPSHAFNYIGIDNDHEQEADYLGERVGGLEPWLQDIYGCKGNLIAKRRKRNPYRRFHPYHTSSPELEGLLEYCPVGNEVYQGPLPWDGI
ncbi:hypothetical protein BCR35DRAFT_300816 [Leucosporidium creatinivorum]|uniref:DUF218 domain-containing protein n=1 Tax=Leucosporidium creatinivorum TaxID=106004 RepID=A0A1Y2G0N5_9BASI|nr:hypothetical protein BCR35DRAFT_300816 [Leucosporidium creatinivorum]